MGRGGRRIPLIPQWRLDILNATLNTLGSYEATR